MTTEASGAATENGHHEALITAAMEREAAQLLAGPAMQALSSSRACGL